MAIHLAVQSSRCESLAYIVVRIGSVLLTNRCWPHSHSMIGDYSWTKERSKQAESKLNARVTKFHCWRDYRKLVQTWWPNCHSQVVCLIPRSKS